MPHRTAMTGLLPEGFHDRLPPAADAAARLEDMSLEDVERVLIQKALAKHQGNVSVAAKALGLSRSALYRRLERYGL